MVFVLDTSISINNEQNFAVMKDFVKNTADLININLNDSLAAVIIVCWQCLDKILPN